MLNTEYQDTLGKSLTFSKSKSKLLEDKSPQTLKAVFAVERIKLRDDEKGRTKIITEC